MRHSNQALVAACGSQGGRTGCVAVAVESSWNVCSGPEPSGAPPDPLSTGMASRPRRAAASNNTALQAVAERRGRRGTGSRLVPEVPQVEAAAPPPVGAAPVTEERAAAGEVSEASCTACGASDEATAAEGTPDGAADDGAAVAAAATDAAPTGHLAAAATAQGAVGPSPPLALAGELRVAPVDMEVDAAGGAAAGNPPVNTPTEAPAGAGPSVPAASDAPLAVVAGSPPLSADEPWVSPRARVAPFLEEKARRAQLEGIEHALACLLPCLARRPQRGALVVDGSLQVALHQPELASRTVHDATQPRRGRKALRPSARRHALARCAPPPQLLIQIVVLIVGRTLCLQACDARGDGGEASRAGLWGEVRNRKGV